MYIYVCQAQFRDSDDLEIDLRIWWIARLRASLPDLAVNTPTVLAIVPPQGCEAILVEILQSKRSAGGPHFTCCFLKSE